MERESVGIEAVTLEDGSSAIDIAGYGLHKGATASEARWVLHAALLDREAGGTGELMTTAEVCEAFSIVPRTLYRWRDAGRLQATRAGRRLLFRRADVMGLMRSDGGRPMSANCE